MDEYVTLIRVHLSIQEGAFYFLLRMEIQEDCLAGEAPATCTRMEPENKANTQRKMEEFQEMERDKS